MLDSELLFTHAERIRASAMLGQTGQLPKLFDYFVECASAGRVPKEIELAVEVFGKKADFETGQDAVVRVYIHKLRRKLDDYYASLGHQESQKLTIPKGDYRLVMESRSLAQAPQLADMPASQTDDDGVLPAMLPAPPPTVPPPTHPAVATVPPRRYWLPWAIGAIAALLVVNIALLLYGYSLFPAGDRELTRVQHSALWRGLLEDDKPVYVAVGDYYIFGELDADGMEVGRLVREFNINSRADLEQHLKNNPRLADRYMDLGLQYLPISIAYALDSVLPLLGHKKGKVQMILASELTPEILKSAHVIYIGLLSGMGLPGELAFKYSRFQIGHSFDELVDKKTQQHYMSEAGITYESGGRNTYRDYGYFSTFLGPSGNRLVVISGTRDVAVMHVAEALSHRDGVDELSKQAAAGGSFEALYAVEAIDRTNLNGHLLLASDIRSDASPGVQATTVVAGAMTSPH
ncbi:hypothetical protein [Hydrocarboniphaga sp.]|uniref:hypothetical protein n=1 Tax=Hydrocarboniphaga sp. TaxID=2033016 RepID=UPI003D11691A